MPFSSPSAYKFSGTNINGAASAYANATTAQNNAALSISTFNLLTSGSQNVSLISSMNALTTGSDNIGIGAGALSNVINGNKTVAIGTQALENYFGDATPDNPPVAIGYKAFNGLTHAGEGVAIGNFAMSKADGGIHAVAIGSEVLRNSRAVYGVFIGRRVMRVNFLTVGGIAIGDGILENYGDNINDVFVIGNNSVASMSNNKSNIFVLGNQALSGFNSAGVSTDIMAIGNYTMQNLLDGSYNIAIGYKSQFGIGRANNTIVIGHRSNVVDTADSTIVIGNNIVNASPFTCIITNPDDVSQKVGIGTLSPSEKLTVNGNIAMNAFKLANGNFLGYSIVNMVDFSGGSAGTLTNAPVAGNPTRWVQFNDNGTIRYIPMW